MVAGRRMTRLLLLGTAIIGGTAFVLPGTDSPRTHLARRSLRTRTLAPSMQDTAGLDLEAENSMLRARVNELEEQLGRTEGLCEVLDSGADFNDSLRSRASWLLGLLICQSGSSFILEGNEALIQSHPVIVYFMTMLVGAGGNAGNQASVRIIRGLATGEVNPVSEGSFIASEVRMAICLSLIVVAAGFIRCAAGTRIAALESTHIQSAILVQQCRGLRCDADGCAGHLACALPDCRCAAPLTRGTSRITATDTHTPACAWCTHPLAILRPPRAFVSSGISIVLGTLLPLVLNRLRLDAAHASTSIQVIMDVLGVTIACTITPFVYNMAAGGGLTLPALATDILPTITAG